MVITGDQHYTYMFMYPNILFMYYNQIVLNKISSLSTVFDQRWIKVIKARVVLEPGMKPNWVQSMRSIIAGFRSYFITASSAILLSVEVRDIGLRSLLTSITCLSFGIGQILSNFQQAGTRFSLNDVFIIIEIGIARITANFFKTPLGRQSGPLDFPSLTPFNDLKTSSVKQIILLLSVMVMVLSDNGW